MLCQTSQLGKCSSWLMIPRHLATSILSLAVLLTSTNPALGEITTEEILARLPISDSDKESIFEGEIVDWAQMVDPTNNREISVGGVLWIPHITPEEGTKKFPLDMPYRVIPIVKAFHEIKGDGTVDDFRSLVLEPNGQEEAQLYLGGEGGETLNLSPQEIALFKDLKKDGQLGGKAQEKVEMLLRRILLARYRDYQTKGLRGIAPYDRDGDLFYPGKEIIATTKNQTFLSEKAPELVKYLLQYPEAKPAKLVERFLWVNLEVFDRPTFALSHRMLYPLGKGYIVLERHFYTSHDYNELAAIALVFPAKGGTLAIYQYRVSTDYVDGFGSSIKRSAARTLMETPVGDLFREIRKRSVKE